MQCNLRSLSDLMREDENFRIGRTVAAQAYTSRAIMYHLLDEVCFNPGLRAAQFPTFMLGLLRGYATDCELTGPIRKVLRRAARAGFPVSGLEKRVLDEFRYLKFIPVVDELKRMFP